MFFGLQPWHVVVIVLAALMIFGPDRLPAITKDAGKVLRQLRRMANDVKTDLQDELGPEIAGLDLTSMSPKALIHKHLLDPALDDVDEERAEEAAKPPAVAPVPVAAGVALTKDVPADAVPVAAAGTPYDLDAT